MKMFPPHCFLIIIHKFRNVKQGFVNYTMMITNDSIIPRIGFPALVIGNNSGHLFANP